MKKLIIKQIDGQSVKKAENAEAVKSLSPLLFGILHPFLDDQH